VKKRRVYWPEGNPQFDAWQFDSPAGTLVVRRNHALATKDGSCHGWDVWLDRTRLGSIGSRSLSELALLSREHLGALARSACCGRHREFGVPERPTRRRGGARQGSGRKLKGEALRVRLTTTIDATTLALIDRLRGSASRGEYLDLVIHGTPPSKPKL
jgi:hypothetical protein